MKENKTGPRNYRLQGEFHISFKFQISLFYFSMSEYHTTEWIYRNAQFDSTIKQLLTDS